MPALQRLPYSSHKKCRSESAWQALGPTMSYAGAAICRQHSQTRHASCLAVWDALAKATWGARMWPMKSKSTGRMMCHISRMVPSRICHSGTSHNHSRVAMAAWSDVAAGCVALGCAQASESCDIRALGAAQASLCMVRSGSPLVKHHGCGRQATRLAACIQPLIVADCTVSRYSLQQHRLSARNRAAPPALPLRDNCWPCRQDTKSLVLSCNATASTPERFFII